MVRRSALALAVPITVTLLCSLVKPPARWLTSPLPQTALSAPGGQPLASPVAVKQERPRIIAVDKRIAKRVDDLRPCVKQRLVRVMRRLPKKVTLLVTSAHRTHAEQASLRGTFGIKAKPGRSTHEDGRAVDVNVLVDGKRIRPRVQHKIIGQAMASEGFRYLGPRDPVHYSIPKEAIDPTVSAVPDLNVMTMGEFHGMETQASEPAAETQAVVANPFSAP